MWRGCFEARRWRSAASRTWRRSRCRALNATAICLRHLLPNIAPLVVAQATILFGYAMVDLAAISFLGLGVQPPSDWGVMIADGQDGVSRAIPWARSRPACASWSS